MSAASALQMLEAFANDVDEELAFADAALPADSLAILLAAIRDCRSDLAALYKRVEQQLLTEAGEKVFVVDGLGEVQINKKTIRRAWDWDDLVPAVISRVMDEKETLYDPESGELLPYHQIGVNVARGLNRCIGFSAGKTTGLRQIGLQPDEFCVEIPDGYTVKLPPRQT